MTSGSAGGSIAGIVAETPRAVWAVGSNGDKIDQTAFILRWTGRRWRLAYAASGELRSVAAAAPDDIWTVGSAGDETPLILHWDGRVWKRIRSPRAGQLNAVAAHSRTDAWTVGSWTPIRYGTEHALIEHWDGRAWSVAKSPEHRFGDGLQAVASISRGDVWVVGYAYSGGGDTGESHALIEHWNGRRWAVVPTPGGDDDLSAVGVVGPNDAWAVGTRFSGRESEHPLVVRWNGANWRVVPLTIRGDFTTILTRSRRDALFLGSTSGRPLVQRWNGATFDALPAPKVPRGDITAATAADGVLWVAGTTGESRPFIARCRLTGGD